jgi:hypothetical protein
MAQVRKRTWKTGETEKSAWVADYRDLGGKLRLKTFATRKAADAWLVEARHEISQGVHTPASVSITVGEAGDLWFAQAESDGLERSTLNAYRTCLKRARNSPVREVDGEVVTSVRQARAGSYAGRLASPLIGVRSGNDQ